MAALYIYIFLLTVVLMVMPNVTAMRNSQPPKRRLIIFLLTFVPNFPVLIAALANPLIVIVYQLDPIAWFAWAIACRMAGIVYFQRREIAVAESGPRPLGDPTSQPMLSTDSTLTSTASATAGCPGCGATVNPDDRFCGSCGHKQELRAEHANG